MRSGRLEHVAGAMDSSDERFSMIERALKLGSEAVDVDVEGVLFYFGGASPAGFDELFAGGDEASALHQKIQQLELLSREGNVFSVTGRETAAWVERDVTCADDDRFGPGDSSCDRSDTCQQDLKDKGLDEVVIGTKIERVQDLGNGIDCSEDQYGGLAVLHADSVQDLESVDAGKQDVQKCGIKVSCE